MYVAMYVNSVASEILDRLRPWYYFLIMFVIEERQIIFKRFWWVGCGFSNVWSTKGFSFGKTHGFAVKRDGSKTTNIASPARVS